MVQARLHASGVSSTLFEQRTFDVHGASWPFFDRATTNLVALYGKNPRRAETLTINLSRSLERTKSWYCMGAKSSFKGDKDIRVAVDSLKNSEGLVSLRGIT